MLSRQRRAGEPCGNLGDQGGKSTPPLPPHAPRPAPTAAHARYKAALDMAAGPNMDYSTRDEGARWGRDLAFVVKIKKTQESTPSVPVMPKKNNRDEENMILPFFTTGRFGPLPLVPE